MNRLFSFQLILVILGVLGVIEYKYYRKSKILILIGIIITSSLFFTTNFSVPDFIMYEDIYNFKINYTGIEKIYIGLGQIFKKIGFSFYIFRIIVGIVTTLLLYRGFYKITFLPNLTMLYYMGYQFLEKPYIQIRNALSIAIFINVLVFFIQRKFLKSFIGIIISSLFHISSYFYFITYFFSKIKFNAKRIKLYFMFFSIGGILLYYINFIEVLRLLGNMNLGRISERINMYFFSEAGKIHIRSSEIGIRVIINYFLFFIYTLRMLELEKRKDINLNKEKYIFYFLGVVSLFRMLSYKIGIFTRVIGNFDFAEVIALVFLIKSIKSKKNKVLYFFITYLYIIVLNYKVGKDLGLW